MIDLHIKFNALIEKKKIPSKTDADRILHSKVFWRKLNQYTNAIAPYPLHFLLVFA